MEDLSKELGNIPQTIEEYLVHTIYGKQYDYKLYCENKTTIQLINALFMLVTCVLLVIASRVVTPINVFLMILVALSYIVGEHWYYKKYNLPSMRVLYKHRKTYKKQWQSLHKELEDRNITEYELLQELKAELRC